MRVAYGIAIVLALVLVFGGAHPVAGEEPAAQPGGLRLAARVDPESAAARDPLRLTAVFENTGSTPAKLFLHERVGATPFPRWRLVREDGVVYAPMPFVGQSMWTKGIQGSFREISPGGRFEHTHDASTFCLVGADGALDADSPVPLEAGTYTVTCAHAQKDATVPFGLDGFRVREEPVPGMWTGALSSDPVRLVVRSPKDPYLRLEVPDGVVAGDAYPVRVTVVNPRDEALALRGAFVVGVSSKMYGGGQARLPHDLALAANETFEKALDLAALSYVRPGPRAGTSVGLYDRIPDGHVFVQVTFVDETGKAVLTGNSPMRVIAARPLGAPPGLRLTVTALGGRLVKVALRNESTAALRVPRRLSYPADLSFAITDADGRRRATRSTTMTASSSLDDLGRGLEPGETAVIPEGSSWDGDAFERPEGRTAGDFGPLAPGEEIARTLDLGKLVHGGLPTGRLSVRAFWRNLDAGRRLGLDVGVVVGSLVSDAVVIDSPAR